MGIISNLKIRLFMYCFLICFLGIVNTALAENPVYFADAVLKAAIEDALGVTDPTPTDMLGLSKLIADRKGITDLTGIEYATNLTELQFHNNQISDISPLAGLTNLTEFRLYSNQISDISPLAGLTNLTELLLLNNQISDISPLAGLTNLTELDLSSNQINDISPLAGLTNLTKLELYSNQISDISSLAGLTNLTKLWFYLNPISDISPLAGLTNLTYLFLTNNQISDISALAGLTNLTGLILSSNQISDISSLAGLTNLTCLYLNNNKISDISVVAGLTNLTCLYLNNNQISDISAVAGLTNLTDLRLYSNQISDISPLAGLTNLSEFILKNNQISDISPLVGLTKLTELRLNLNQISDISPLAGLTNLTRLELENNQISDISPLAGLTNLTRLYLENNQISDISPLVGLTKLIYLNLRNNQLNYDAYYEYIPTIKSRWTVVHFDPLQWRTLTINSTEGGSVIKPGEGNFEYTNLTVVEVNAEAEPGYYFIGWTGTAVDADKVADPTTSSTTVIMDANYTLVANFEEMIFVYLYVDDNAPNDPAPCNPGISDPAEDGSPEHPFDTIQEAIDVSENSDTILVYPGIYQEEINFLGKAITVQGIATSEGIPILENPGDFAISFYYGEGPDSILKNFIIRDSFIAVFIAGSSPTISNVTVVNNKYGIEAYADSQPDISNSIFWNNTGDDLYQCQARYSCIERGYTGEGNISMNPLFVDPNNSNYRLCSNRGRYWSEHDVWILDDITSPCIDGGDPLDDPSEEPVPNGNLINMGAYGGTEYASLSLLPIIGEVLPPEVIELVHGITGGFHYDSTWFIAKFNNRTDYTITRVTIKIKLTDRITNDFQWFEVMLGPPGAVIPPGETVILSGDVGVARGNRDFYWVISEMMGYID